MESMSNLERSLLFMRDPLSRIELAASQLDRIERGIVTHDLIESIHRAVEDLDVQLHEAVAAIRRPHRPMSDDDCGEALRRLVSELHPVFSARSRRLEPLISPHEVRGDVGLARRAALRLLRGAGSWTGAGGMLRLSLLADSGRWGVRVAARRSAGATERHTGLHARRPFDDARRFAQGVGGELDQPLPRPGGSEMSATLWFPGKEVAA